MFLFYRQDIARVLSFANGLSLFLFDPKHVKTDLLRIDFYALEQRVCQCLRSPLKTIFCFLTLSWEDV